MSSFGESIVHVSQDGEVLFHDIICPRLEELHIKGGMGLQDVYSRIILDRRKPESAAREIRKLVFEDCYASGKRASYGADSISVACGAVRRVFVGVSRKQIASGISATTEKIT